MYPVYLITCSHPKYGSHIKPYVGVVLANGKTVEQRFKEHTGGNSNAPALCDAIKSIGREYFAVQQIDAGNTPKQALELEAWWVKRLGTIAPNGYNLTAGGEGVRVYHRGRKMSAETKAKISASLVGKSRPPRSEEHRRKLGAARRGKPNPHTPEWNMKIGDANRGKVRTEEQLKRLSEAHVGQVPWQKLRESGE